MPVGNLDPDISNRLLGDNQREEKSNKITPEQAKEDYEAPIHFTEF